ncbi:terminase large subunit domain-containing protein [Parvularcula sp. IMCC14364]|uniref:terminase large subunit domain-containing protein n=1 Tax=Parvularcula sp. IMCC14364 TaxID=3067902 RepID=UPI002741C003|nr:terminase large subunit [Parvularcula sp. IMCC14364]
MAKGRPRVLSEKALRGGTKASKCVRFLETLRIPEGPKAGEQIRLAPFQKSFVEGSLDPKNNVGVLSVSRGNGKSALTAGICLGALLGVWDKQPRRDIILAAKTRDQARIAWQFAEGFAQSLPDEYQARLTFRRSPRLEIQFDDENGPHVIRAIAADGKSALGSGPTLVLMDERGHWPTDKGDALEQALLTGLGKRDGRALIISTSAADDTHPFSHWIDRPPAGCYVQEHRPLPSLPADDLDSLLIANPGADYGVGATSQWLLTQAERAIQRGGNTLSSFRLYHRNERVSGEERDVLLTVDQWLAAETNELPAREGGVVIGLDLGGSASMTAAAYFWPKTGRLEVYGWFPSDPSLANRGLNDGVGDRYLKMAERGELETLGNKTVPVAAWLSAAMRRVEGEQVIALLADRFKQAEFLEALQSAGISTPVIWRGFGFKDGGEDIERFRRAVFDGKVWTTESLLMRSAISETVCIRDPANNIKLAKSRSLGRIDPASAAVLAVAEGARQLAKPLARAPRVVWA